MRRVCTLACSLCALSAVACAPAATSPAGGGRAEATAGQTAAAAPVVTIAPPPASATASASVDEEEAALEAGVGAAAEGAGDGDVEGAVEVLGPVGILRSTPPAGSSPRATAAPTPKKPGCWPGDRGCPLLGVPECDAMFRQARACFQTLPIGPSAEEAMLDGIEGMRSAIQASGPNPAVRRQLAQACSQAAASLTSACSRPTP